MTGRIASSHRHIRRKARNRPGFVHISQDTPAPLPSSRRLHIATPGSAGPLPVHQSARSRGELIVPAFVVHGELPANPMALVHWPLASLRPAQVPTLAMCRRAERPPRPALALGHTPLPEQDPTRLRRSHRRTFPGCQPDRSRCRTEPTNAQSSLASRQLSARPRSSTRGLTSSCSWIGRHPRARGPSRIPAGQHRHD